MGRNLWLVFLIWLGCAQAQAQAQAADLDGVLLIDAAEAVLTPQGLPAQPGLVDLRVRWDVSFPGLGGHALYRIKLPPSRDAEAMALLFARVGNQAVIRLNGQILQRYGVLGDSRHDAAKRPQLVAVPAALLRADRSNELEVEVSIQHLRLGGLSMFSYGPQAPLARLYDEQLFWRHSTLLGYTLTRVGVGLILLLLWWRQGEALYACFGAATLLAAVRPLERLWPEVPLAWPHLGLLVSMCLAASIVLNLRFVLLTLGPVPSWQSRLLNAALWLALPLLFIAYEGGQLLALELAIYLSIPLGLLTFGLVLRKAWTEGNKLAWIWSVIMLGVVAAAIYDIAMIRGDAPTGLRTTLTQHVSFAILVVMCILIAERYSRSVAGFRALSSDLGKIVAEREQQLQQAFEGLREQRHQQSVQEERQRMMREIHDGVGAQLVALLNMVARPDAKPVLLQEQVQQALDEMRMAVDSLQPVHDDLLTVLATLRYRLQARLEAAGIRVIWDVTDLPALPQLSPHKVLQVQRILLEAFTNILKHARATEVTVTANYQAAEPAMIRLRIADNGVGMGAEASAQASSTHLESAPRGRGIGNMQARAAALGAQLRLESQLGAGFSITLDWPMDPVAPSDASA